MAVQKAFILVLEGAKKNQKIEVMFNPETFSIDRSNSWSDGAGAGRGIPKAKFTGAERSSMDIELWFDNTSTGTSVTEHTDKLFDLLKIDKSIPGTDEKSNNARPPTVTFNWGKLVSFPAYVAKVDVEFVYFAADGEPLRAKVDMELKQYVDEAALKKTNPTSGTPFPHRVHRFMPGETLDRISAQYYDDSNHWRALASANGIEDPLAIRPGSLIVIPEITSL